MIMKMLLLEVPFSKSIIIKNHQKMRTIQLISVLLLAVTLSSCRLIVPDIPHYNHYLFLNIRDASGVDLVKQLALHEANREDFVSPNSLGHSSINPELYALEAEFADKMLDPIWRYNNDPDIVGYVRKDAPCLEFVNKEGVYYLTFHPRGSYGRKERTPPAQWITYRLTCPTIFGDNEAHEIKTFWRPPKKTSNNYQVCYQIDYANNQIVDITVDQYDHLYYATIHL